MSTPAAENVDRLPKWAQRRIERLERDLAYVNAKLATGPEESDTFADHYSEDARRPLGQGTSIAFVKSRRADGSARDYYTARMEEDGTLYVHATDTMAIVPQSSNAVHMRILPR